ncbi:MAG: nucleotidyltransferase, partial [Candidatus Rokuibacteriota bacterium]
MMPCDQLGPKTAAFYRDALTVLIEADVPFVVGGAYAFECYTGIARDTKDIDVFVRRADTERALAVLAQAGYRTEMTFPHWLGKAFGGDDDVLDVIFSSGNGIAEVDDTWFEHARDDEVLGIPVKLSPPEEMIWSKAFIMERERFDGADVAHVLRARAEHLDWPRLLARFGANWRPLLAHLVLFGFIYPSERQRIPHGVMR